MAEKRSNRERRTLTTLQPLHPPQTCGTCDPWRIESGHSYDTMGCGASKPPESPESAPEKLSIYKALDVKPPASAAPPRPAAAAAELHRPTALQKQATGRDDVAG